MEKNPPKKSPFCFDYKKKKQKQKNVLSEDLDFNFVGR